MMGKDVDKKWLETMQNQVIATIVKNNERYGALFPEPASKNLQYYFGENRQWTPSFWTGMQFLAYELTADEKFLTIIEKHLDSFDERLRNNIEMDNHDVGFYFSLSHIPAYEKLQRSASRQTIISAADKLLERYEPHSKILQAWGAIDDPSEQGRMIIDCNMNLFLLYKAFYLTGNQKYYDIAYGHIKKAQQYLVRDDYSTYHTYFFDVNSGKPLRGTTAQGYSDQSCWARGQAWAVYGFALNYQYTGDLSLLETAMKTADYFIEYLPEDYVPYWDLIFTEGKQYRDASAGAILVCGLLELVKVLPVTNKDRKKYEQVALAILYSLGENYTVKQEKSNGVLLHSVYSIPHDLGVDECCLWGDYFYFEALVSASTAWNSYW
ncbi:unsaturated chondroitin disaccharide hydrolase [Enterococcus sp. PF1-24]|uniref:glycoside hydrolase family 88 protein n=1 Tax=unclassified Enterococcus TaxID=2608891 RepID=UPI002473CCEB|nr:MULTISPECIES: glycoside hydrolase family 88 protein [unclassified Enterococcus]MDH6363428.1 unsaturated chondroitin disaccharide hydrolase [Enterococcus sp. PFB1-1]MDH6400522.1 unsaturated chondroitin disaccharide hydrolase [Enterococcus sp. PF1-24]